MKKIRIIRDYRGPAITEMNPTLSEILVSNLISNAIRHNVEGGEIAVTMDPDGFLISNTGHPLTIPPEQLFRRFRKSERISDSVGLGLAIVRKIVQFYQFEITYEVQDNIHQFRLKLFPGKSAI